MQASEIELIRKLPLFRDIDVASFKTFLAAGSRQCVAAGAILLQQGAVPDALYVLVDGRMAFVDNDGGRKFSISGMAPRSAFDLAAVILDKPCLKASQTLEPSTVFAIPAGLVRDVFKRDLMFAQAVAAELAWEYRASVKELKKLRLQSAPERLASWVVSQDRAAGGKGSFRIDTTKRVLASQLGMCPESLSRTFVELAAHGVAVDGPVIKIVNRDALLSFSRPNALIDDPER